MTSSQRKTRRPLETLASVERAMTIIEMLADAEKGLSISEIARQLSVNKSIALRILATLEQLGYLFKHPHTQNYTATYKLSNFGLRILVTNRLMDQCHPIVRDLSEKSGELVLLAVVEANEPRWVMAASGPTSGASGERRRLLIDPIAPIVYHSTATGKAWLSTLTDAKVLEVLGTELKPKTDFTVRSKRELMEQIAEIRRTGLAMSIEEHEPGVGAIAAPVWVAGTGDRRLCVGIVSITAPLSRATKEVFEEFGRLLREASRALGDSWPFPDSGGMLKARPEQGMRLVG